VAKIKVAIAIIETIHKDHPLTKEVLVTFHQFTTTHLNIEIVWVCKTVDFTTYTRALQEINLAIKEQFDAESIGFAQTGQTIISIPSAR
jgi:small-conductance mechanosensitive channel